MRCCLCITTHLITLEDPFESRPKTNSWAIDSYWWWPLVAWHAILELAFLESCQSFLVWCLSSWFRSESREGGGSWSHSQGHRRWRRRICGQRKSLPFLCWSQQWPPRAWFFCRGRKLHDDADRKDRDHQRCVGKGNDGWNRRLPSVGLLWTLAPVSCMSKAEDDMDQAPKPLGNDNYPGFPGTDGGWAVWHGFFLEEILLLGVLLVWIVEQIKDAFGAFSFFELFEKQLSIFNRSSSGRSINDFGGEPLKPQLVHDPTW